MVLTTVFLTRHGVRLSQPRLLHGSLTEQARSNWTTDPRSGAVTTSIRSPTGIPTDPPLSAMGVVQARELGELGTKLETDQTNLSTKPRIVRVYSSPFYRCLQTISPLWTNLCSSSSSTSTPSSPFPSNPTSNTENVPFICDRGLGEWFGLAPFEHLGPAALTTLVRLFPSVTERTVYTPPARGESIWRLHDRCAAALAQIISDVDAALGDMPGQQAIVVCSHAAPLITMGRALTGTMPADVNAEDFDTWTCGVSRFERREQSGHKQRDPKTRSARQWTVADYAKGGALDWRNGRGIAGGWDCMENSSTVHLSGGPVRNWHFNGDESFFDTSGHLVTTDATVEEEDGQEAETEAEERASDARESRGAKL